MSKKKKSKIWIVAFLLLVLGLSPVLINQQKMIYAKSKEMKQIQTKIKAENKVKEDLLRQMKILNTDEYAEKIAREKFGMIKPGEKIFIDVNK